MQKTLNGGAIVNYGSELPATTTSFNGALYHKTDGEDSGLYIYSKSVSSLRGLEWIPAIDKSKYIPSTGGTIYGSFNLNRPYAARQVDLVDSLTLTSDTVPNGNFWGALKWNRGTTTSTQIASVMNPNGDSRITLSTSVGNMPIEERVTIDSYGVIMQGDVIATGSYTSNYSDMRLKTKVRQIDNAVNTLSTLSGWYYTTNDLAKSFGYTSDDLEVGLMAQDVQQVIPEIIDRAPFDNDGNGGSKTGEEYLTVKYERLIPHLVEAIKELNARIVHLETELASK